MKLILLSVILLSFISFPQDDTSTLILQHNFHSPQNRKKFADFLFCEEDYLRSIDEYKKYLQAFPDDTAEFKIGLALSRMKKFDEAAGYFADKGKSYVFFNQSEIEYHKSLLQSGNFNLLREKYIESSKSPELKMLNHLSYLYSGTISIPQKEFLNLFPEHSRNEINSFYKWANDPPVKSELTAVLLSAVIPGAGKFYIGEYGDGIAAFAATVLFAYISYDNFKAKHKFRGWLFTGISAFFYAGNIYGSAAGVQIFNAKLYLEFYNDLNIYLDRHNYFLPEYDFCR
jgi:TM2 domain-containing membrane protein YozV